ncbi:MAG: MFS transporter [Proteobacteria bacterium]|nr:MFS transporter [Pseudomonadota bacterium]
MTDGTHQEVKFYGWINVVFLFLLYAIVMGFVFYGFTVIFPAMLKAQGWGRGEASLGHTIRGLVVGFMAPLAAVSIGKLGAKKTLGMGLLAGALALTLLGTVTSKLWHWTLIWGFMMPAAFSLGGLLPIQTTVNFWFNTKRAMATGIVMTSAAIAGTVAAPFYTFIMAKTGGWQVGWLVGAGLCAVGFILTFFIKNTPQSIGQFPDGIDPDAAPKTGVKAKAKGVYQTKTPWTLKEALRTRVVWLQMVCMIGQVWALYIVTVHGVLHLIDKQLNPMQAASVLSTLILCSGIARFPMGVLADRIEPRIITVFALLGMGIALLGIWQAPQNVTFLMAIAGVYGFSFGATVIMFPMLTANYFGPAAFAPINGFITPILILVAAPVPVVAGMIFDHYKSYDLAFIPIIIFVFIAAVCAWFLYPPQKKAIAS